VNAAIGSRNRPHTQCRASVTASRVGRTVGTPVVIIARIGGLRALDGPGRQRRVGDCAAASPLRPGMALNLAFFGRGHKTGRRTRAAGRPTGYCGANDKAPTGYRPICDGDFENLSQPTPRSECSIARGQRREAIKNHAQAVQPRCNAGVGSTCWRKLVVYGHGGAKDDARACRGSPSANG